jgi:hypothetical protein
MSKQNPLLEISPFKTDNGELVGRVPAEVPLEFLRRKISVQKPVLSEVERQRRTALLQGAPPASPHEKAPERSANRTEAKPKPSHAKKRNMVT